MKRSFRSNIPVRIDIALLLLRVWAGASLFVKHGLEKVTHFQDMAAHFPDPIHIGPRLSLIYALITDALCSILVAVGFATRLAAFLIVVNLGVVFGAMHQFSFMADHAELVYLYFGVFATLMITGAGRFSVDSYL
ncbi:DoxX family protein [Dinghuibacter silviterrae]|uniref:Putative oxidoreductase n=1 Tax=Dinghuibacter silviterrae TaxID=1539049 RepID=A0A4R8DHU7_9BACT|nr:DoxX family protein [Dinghuibacter silviterrae]TDW96834.1 putative oxidoreductase [Dinghuibacter silviterrae]